MEHHSLGHLIWFLIIGGLIGWLAGLITRGRGFGILGDIAIGIVGSMFGGWIADVLGISINSSFGEFMMAILGAVLLVGLTRLIVRAGNT
jgi:uncharacterized membrane protein YeaQ/YmgE (transglycosylase-associated protein family)